MPGALLPRLDLVPPPAVDPSNADRIAAVVELWAKVAGGLVIVWGFLERVAKPYYEWRKRRYAELIREVLKAELERLDGICEREEAIQREQQRILERQSEIFGDLDTLIEISSDNRDRLDEMNELLDFLGLASRDRRAEDAERKERLDGLLDIVAERRKQRRRDARELPLHPGQPNQRGD